MRNLLRHSAGVRPRSRRKMQCVLLWFYISGIAKGTFSAEVVTGTPAKIQTTSGTISNYFNEEILQENDSTADKSSKFEFASDRTSRSVPMKIQNNDSLGNVLENKSKLEPIQKSPIYPKSIFIFPYYRPGRSEDEQKDLKNNENQNVVNTVVRYARSSDSSSSELLKDNSDLKRHDTVIPMIRFGRRGGQKRKIYYNSVLPHPRLGRSIKKNLNQMNKDIDGLTTDEIENDISEDENIYAQETSEDSTDSEQIQKREFEDYETIIPYPRPGREILEDGQTLELSEKKSEGAGLDYIVPQIRYGRSMLLLSPPRTEKDPKNKAPQTFVLPYPRPGRSNKYRVKYGNSETAHLILPYPRPGRSGFDETISKRMEGNQRGYMLPSARLGRAALGTLYKTEGKDSLYADDERFLGLKVNPYSLKAEEKNLSENPKDKTESSSVFIIPYPRPGKKSMFKTTKGKQKSNNIEKEITDYVLPYPRPGKKSATQKLQRNNNDGNQNTPSKNFVFPYPRPGRSSDYLSDQNARVNQLYENQFEDLLDGMFEENEDVNKIKENENYENINIVRIDEVSEKRNKKYDNKLMTPYARLGSDFRDIVPYLSPDLSTEEFENARAFQYDENNNDSDESGSENFISAMDYTEFDNGSSNHLRFKRSTSVIPYPRIGRSDSVVPYPRVDRPSLVIPYPRLGRSNSAVPYPKFGRSSNAVVPYPRPGRSTSIVPYPRPGRSNTVVPYPRIGRSGSLVPYPRPGRSNAVVPYPRPGRSDSVLPYPRPGRSNSIVPYPRPGRSDAVVPYPRPGRSLSVVPYPRLGRSSTEKIIPSKNNNKLGNWLLPNIRPGRSNSKREGTYIVPYPRPGRSKDTTDELHNEKFKYSFIKKGLEKNLIIPYPRLGRTTKGQGYVLPHPRIGRSERNESDTANRNTVIPYPRLGRSQKEIVPSSHAINSVHKLNKHILNSVDQSIYLLPYPRPGRYSE